MKSAHDSQTPAEVKQLGFLEIAVLVLSVYVLGALLAQAILPLSPGVNSLLDSIDSLICLVFIADFCIRYRRAASKVAFLKWGWIDLVSSIPAVGFVRWGRLVRVIRIFRMLRAFRSAKHLMAFLYRNRTRSLVGTAALSAAVLVISSGIGLCGAY
jgi:voltage-gated potassium channel